MGTGQVIVGKYFQLFSAALILKANASELPQILDISNVHRSAILSFYPITVKIQTKQEQVHQKLTRVIGTYHERTRICSKIHDHSV